MAVKGILKINGHDYTRFVKSKSGIHWSRENTNDEDAKRDADQTMHPNVTSHQRKLEIKMGPMMLEDVQRLEKDLQGNDEGVRVQYPDLYNGLCTRLFYNTSIKAAVQQFTDDGVVVDDISFNLISINEGLV